MKILNLKFKNINSLSGENEIDFTSPEFTNEGLFAITGKTGSGKSSILDAISLAIYGRTPRVDVTGNENAVMTRGEKDCYAEIIFEVAGKKWKSSWKQELTRTGNLKPVSRTIADSQDKIIADQVRLCDTKIVEIVGLTFEQFTKVIMLAQGSFAAFLQADKNDKGELLEQITGTEIYGEISKKVFDRNRREKEKLDKILIELQSIKILSAEEIQILTNQQNELEKDKKIYDEQLIKLDEAKKWLGELSALQKQIEETKLKLPGLEEKLKSTKELYENAENAFKIAKDELKKNEPVFLKVRELDTKIAEKDKLLLPLMESIIGLEKSKNQLTKMLGDMNNELGVIQKLLLEKQDWANKHKKYEELVSNYTAIEKENQLLLTSRNEIKKNNNEIAELQKDLQQKQTNSKNAIEAFLETEKTLTAKTNEYELKKTEIVKILGGKDLASVRQDKESLVNFVLLIKDLLGTETAIRKSKTEILSCEDQLKQFKNLALELTGKTESQSAVKSELETKINLLEENILLTKTIQSLDEHRQNLKDGEECPLCGSFSHPFADGNIPKIGEKESELKVLKTQLKACDSDLQLISSSYQKVISDTENVTKNKGKFESALDVAKSKRKELLLEIVKINSDFKTSDDINTNELSDYLAEQEAVLKEMTSIIDKATIVEKQIAKLRDDEIPAFQEKKQISERLKSEAETAQKLVEQGLKTKLDLLALADEKYKTEKNELLKRLKNYSVETIEELKKCLNDWVENTKQTEELTRKTSELVKTIELNKKELENQLKHYAEKTDEKQKVDAAKQKLVSDRKEIFAEKSVEIEENRLKKIVEECELSKEKVGEESSQSVLAIEKSKAILSKDEAELKQKIELNISEKTVEEIEADLNKIRITRDEISEKIGANNQELISNAENQKISGAKIKASENQKLVCRKWGSLNELIGSGDGKKYRNFAQALTFEHLIGMANKQLRKMSDRYILKRTNDSSNPFELHVIDGFQNSEERTAQNLSGGEKFIVSLSLALGLANMASKNMQIDTMFIDEGFGTLDSDYLDVALNTLSNLQSEGKIIGVISHLNELKERIATHIEVIPIGSGHSKIQITH